MKKNESTLTGGMCIAIFFFGGGLWLLFNRPWIFWLIFVPAVILIGCWFVKSCKDAFRGKK